MGIDEDIIYTVLSEDEYMKAIGQLRLAVGAVLQPFNMYGLGDYIGPAQAEIVKLCEDFGLRVRGIDKPISVEYVKRMR